MSGIRLKRHPEGRELKAHLFEAVYETDDYLVEALRRCTPAERGWCMWIDLAARSVESRLSED